MVIFRHRVIGLDQTSPHPCVHSCGIVLHPSPEPRAPNPFLPRSLAMSVPLPPSPRDFEIHRLHLVHHMSTWRLAEKYEVSQTRIRQVVKAVSQWLVTTMPVKTEADLEKETRLAQHLAADQLQHQLELLQNYFDGSGDPKYSRQQTRVILALARLGTIPGSIDALAADAEHSRVGCAHQDSRQDLEDLVTSVPPGHAPPRGSSLAEPPTSATSINPPLGDFSPITNSNDSKTPTPESDGITTPLHEASSRPIPFPDEEFIPGLCLMEKRLLTLLDNAAPSDQERRERLEESLANVRHQKATLELRLSPNNPGASISTGTLTNSPTHHSPTPQVCLASEPCP